MLLLNGISTYLYPFYLVRTRSKSNFLFNRCKYDFKNLKFLKNLNEFFPHHILLISKNAVHSLPFLLSIPKELHLASITIITSLISPTTHSVSVLSDYAYVYIFLLRLNVFFSDEVEIIWLLKSGRH